MRRVLVTGIALLVVVAADARAATVTSLSVNSDARDFIGQGIPRVAHPGGAQASAVRDTYGHGGVAMGATVGGEGISVEVAPAPDEALRPHNWTQIERYPFQDPGRAGLTVSAGNRLCNQSTGRVEVLDAAFEADGTPKRLWAIFDHHCEGGRSSAFGEVRWNAWVPDAAAHVTPGILRWPVLDGWWPAAPATVVYHGAAAATKVSVAGADAAHFAVRADGCTGKAPPCGVEVGFSPTAAGRREARLEIVDAAGATHAVTLQGFLHGGTTSADIEVLDGDVAAPPEDRGMHSYTPADTSFAGREYSPNPIVSLFLQDRDDVHEWWNVDLYAGGGAKLQPGASYPNAQGNADGPGPGIRVDGGPAWCNQSASSFTVHSITYMPDGTLRSLDTSFERRCYDDQRAAARGTWRFRAGDSTPVPDWLVPGPRPQIEVPQDPAAPTQPGGTAGGDGPAAGAGVRLPAGCRAPGARVRRGTPRADRLRGTRRADVLLGRGGNDRIRAGAGRDCVLGGRGNDRLMGGPGRDFLDCGRGRRDVVRAGRRDRVRNCERMIRR